MAVSGQQVRSSAVSAAREPAGFGRQLLERFAGFAGRKPASTRMRHQTLLLLRWLAVAGQTLAILFVHFLLGHPVPLVWCAAPISASIWLNLILAFRYPPSKRLTDREAAFYMGFDILQLASLLYFTGGLLNPFAILFLAPVTIAASTLNRRSTILLAALSLAAISVLATGFHWRLPWPVDEAFYLPQRYEFGVWAALVIGIAFSAIFAWRVTAEANRMSDALAATELVLAREQRLSAVGALAAAAAHELGTPLATISVVTRELERDMARNDPHAEDIILLRSQAERCREILNRLTLEAQAGQSLLTASPLESVLEEIIAPHRGLGVEIEIRIRTEAGSRKPSLVPDMGLEIWRRPEIVHGLGNLVENAVDFAKSRVDLDVIIGPSTFRIRVADDGPGFPKDVLDHLGEPFISTRSRLETGSGADDQLDAEEIDEHHGMGLGFFIAKTLLERTGAELAAGNLAGEGDLVSEHPAPRGAVVTITWPTRKILVQKPASNQKSEGNQERGA